MAHNNEPSPRNESKFYEIFTAHDIQRLMWNDEEEEGREKYHLQRMASIISPNYKRDNYFNEERDQSQKKIMKRMESKSLKYMEDSHTMKHAQSARHDGMSMYNPKSKLMEQIHENANEDMSSKSGSFDPNAETPAYDHGNIRTNFKQKISNTLMGDAPDFNDTPQVRLDQKLRELKKKNEALNLSSGKKTKDTIPLQAIEEKEEYKEKTSGVMSLLSLKTNDQPAKSRQR